MISRLSARAVRAAATAVVVATISAATALASLTGTPPVVSSLNAHVVTNGFSLQINGNHFSNDATGACDQVGGTPTVHFQALGVGTSNFPEQTAQPSTDSQHCTNTMIVVGVPNAVTGAAKIVVTDSFNQSSIGGLVPIITIAPQLGLQPSSTGRDIPVQIQGSNVQPPTEVGTQQQVTIGQHAWSISPGGTFTPGNVFVFSPTNAYAFPVQISFPICDNASDNCAAKETLTVGAGTYTFLPPSLSTAAITHKVVGDQVTLPGQNLGSSAGSVTFPGPATGQSVHWSQSGITVTVPPGAQPGTVSASVPTFGPVSGPSIGLDPKATGMSPAAGSAGQTVQVTGYNFGTSTGTVAVAGAGAQLASWGDQGVSFVISQDSDGGAVTVTRADGAVASVSNLTIVPRLDRIETPTAPPGAQVLVDGVSLGSAQGTATAGGTPLQVLLWSRDNVMLQVPTSIAPGVYPLVLTTAAGTPSNPLNLTISAKAAVTGPTATPGHTATGAPTGIGGALAPSFDNNHDFVKPIKPPSPVSFNVTTDPHKVQAGGEASVTVTLKINDKPVQGATVKLDMLFTPGNDYKFTPDSGVTDHNGVFTARVRVSKTPGDSIIAATSGVFSDQDHVTGTTADGKTVAAQQGSLPSNGGFAPLVALGVAALVLVGAGFYLNMRSMEH